MLIILLARASAAGVEEETDEDHRHQSREDGDQDQRLEEDGHGSRLFGGAAGVVEGQIILVLAGEVEDGILLPLKKEFCLE